MKISLMTIILEIKAEKKLTWGDVAEMGNVSESTMCNWRNGRSEPSLSTVERLFNGLGYELEVVEK